jgi:enamine deaminase RidA (YjgF/YER057c/UK114 family)
VIECDSLTPANSVRPNHPALTPAAPRPTRPPQESPRQVLLLPGWPRPKGYANGVTRQGSQVFIAGMTGWDAPAPFHSDDFGEQARYALHHIVSGLADAGGRPEPTVRLTWYMLDKREYLAAGKAVGQAFRELIGGYHAAMTAVEVRALIDDRARVGIKATAVIPDRSVSPGQRHGPRRQARPLPCTTPCRYFCARPAAVDLPRSIFELPALPRAPERRG